VKVVPNSATLSATVLRARCPHCSGPGLFVGVVQFAKTCKTCGLDFGAFNVGDGPAAFLVLIVGALVSIGAITLQLSLEPPFWVHILVWVPVTTGLVIGLLRLAKAALLFFEYKNRAQEGTIAP
jgi:uncharacterized protein (DUF983 family)